MTTDVKPRKYAVIICEDAPKWGTQEELGKMLIDCFKNGNDEVWEYFSACEGQLPDIDKVNEYKAFIVSGSHYSANDSFDWVKKLEEFLKCLYDYQQGRDNPPKLSGICFGHQMIGKALGAKVVKNTGGRFIFKQVDINPIAALSSKGFYQEVFGNSEKFTLFQSHGEEVIELPTHACRVASSDCCQNEAVSYGDHVLTLQGHMEITEQDMLDKILPSLKNAKLHNDEEEEVMRKTLKKVNDRKRVVAMIRLFIDQ